MKRRLAVLFFLISPFLIGADPFQNDAPFDSDRNNLDGAATGRWWEKEFTGTNAWLADLTVPREEVIGFALYTVHRETMKMTAQLYPLLPDDPKEVRLELLIEGKWTEVQTSPVAYPGWSAHFRIPNWNTQQNTRYRLRHGAEATYQGLIRKDPHRKTQIVVASLSCNAKFDRGDRETMVSNLRYQNPDLLFFAGDQSYDHSQHTAAWLMWGRQFREVTRDRPTITITDDHDVGQANIWGEGGRKPPSSAASGGYAMPVEYVKMVERCQTWHLPDPYDPTPIDRGIGVYYTSLNVGGIDFAILEDRKFKSGPHGKLPHYEPKRPDHINDSNYDPASIDLPGLEILGQRQIDFLHAWGQDWTGTEMKGVLSQTNFAGAVHLHGYQHNRLLADLDSNGWPQTPRKEALREIRRALAVHLAGDQHLAVVTQHGIDSFRDGPFSAISPAIVNEIYGRWWWPEDEKPGARSITRSPLPWTGDYHDGFGNKITMFAYANPANDSLYRRDDNDVVPPEVTGDGYSIARFNKKTREITFECWPRKANAFLGDAQQYPGWPLTIHMNDNDGREIAGYLPTLNFHEEERPVVQVIDESNNEILYTKRVSENSFQPQVYRHGSYTVKIGTDKPNALTIENLASSQSNKRSLSIQPLSSQ